MDEILDDEFLGKTKQEGISFTKWWERRRILFNLILVLAPSMYLLMEGATNLFFIFFVIANVSYTIFPFLSFLFKRIFKKNYNPNLYSFFQNRKLWIGLFGIKIFIAILITLILIGGGSAEAPYLLLLF